MTQNQDQKNIEKLDLAFLEKSLLDDQELESLLEKKEIEFNHLQKDYQELNLKIEEFKKKEKIYENQKHQLDEIQEKLRLYEKELKESSEKNIHIQTLQVEIEKLKKNNHELEGKIRLSAEPQLNIREKLDSYRRELEKKEILIKKLELNLRTSKKNNENKTINELKEKIKDFESKIIEKSTKIHDLEKQIKQINEEKNSISCEMEKLRKQNHAYLNNISKLKKQEQDFYEEKCRLLESIKKYENDLSTFEQKVIKIQKLESDLEVYKKRTAVLMKNNEDISKNIQIFQLKTEEDEKRINLLIEEKKKETLLKKKNAIELKNLEKTKIKEFKKNLGIIHSLEEENLKLKGQNDNLLNEIRDLKQKYQPILEREKIIHSISKIHEQKYSIQTDIFSEKIRKIQEEISNLEAIDGNERETQEKILDLKKKLENLQQFVRKNQIG